MRTQYFHSDSYVTPVKRSYSLTGWLLQSRFLFTLRFLGVVIRSRNLAVKGKYDWNEWTRASIDIMRMLEKSGAMFTIEGIDNIRNLSGPVVFVSNHMSVLETLVFPSIVAPVRDVTFVVKDSLVKYPVFKHIMKARNPIVVSRNNSRGDLLKVLAEGADLIAQGISIIIFPQSTRRTSMVRAEFNSLGTKLAARAGVPIVPVAIKTDYWRNGKWIKDLGPLDRKQPVNISFGTPIEAVNNERKAQESIVGYITSRLEAWGVEVI